MLWLWPLMFAVPLIPYRLDSYYPRHFVMFNLTLGIGTTAVLIRLYTRRPTTSDPWFDLRSERVLEQDSPNR